MLEAWESPPSFVLRGLTVAPAERYPSINALSDVLDRYLNAASIAPEPVSTRPRRFPTRAAIGTTIVIGIAAAAALWLRAPFDPIRLLGGACPEHGKRLGPVYFQDTLAARLSFIGALPPGPVRHLPERGVD